MKSEYPEAIAPNSELASAYKTARLARDHRFDGVFYTGVLTTGIFCRPVCPAPAPKETNVRYFRSAAEASLSGLRPCKRCRPELAADISHWHISEHLLHVAHRMINEGFLQTHSINDLADKLGVSDRHLRRMFNQQLGASPIQIDLVRRLLLARRLLLESSLSITEIVHCSGFKSVRRFNDAFKKFYQYPPSAIKQSPGTDSDLLTLTLSYRPPYDWPAMLGFLQARAIAGIEQVTDDYYQRTIVIDQEQGSYRLTPVSGNKVELSIKGISPAALPEIIARVRRQFDLNTDIQSIHEFLATTPLLAEIIGQSPGLRLPSSWDPFETLVRAVVGQQISVVACTTILGRIVARHTEQHGFTNPRFPDPYELSELNLNEIGLTKTRAETLTRVSRAIVAGEVGFSVDQPADDFIEQLTAIKGIGPWTANYTAFRGMGFTDNFPAADLGLRKAMRPLITELASDGLPNIKRVEEYARTWRPYRSYAAILLWHSLH